MIFLYWWSNWLLLLLFLSVSWALCWVFRSDRIHFRSGMGYDCQSSPASRLPEDSIFSDWHLTPMIKVSVPCGLSVTCFIGAPTTLFTYCVQFTSHSLVPWATAGFSGQTLSTVVDTCRGMPVLQTLHPKAFFLWLPLALFGEHTVVIFSWES